MDGRVGETVHIFSSCSVENIVTIKMYKEMLKEIVNATCAMLNSNGGKVMLHDCKKIESLSSSEMSVLVRKLEQIMISIIGTNQTVSNINIEEDKEGTVIFVKKVNSLITTNYNLYLPSQTQVNLVSPLESPEKVMEDIINRNVVLEPVELGSHSKIFVKNKNCSIQESKKVQLKNLKANPSKHSTLADRMVAKGNKFSCYVSAFANHSGGHIYYGIEDTDRVVKGERIPCEQNMGEIIKRVEKTINKMIWPAQIGQPKRGKHWEIFFEPVVDENSKPVPSTFVIVIYIAPCLGGVFIEEPECYEMVEGKVKKMPFNTWKRILQQPVELFHVVQRSTQRSTSKIREICFFADQVLTQSINNGETTLDISAHVEKEFLKITEVQLLVLSKQVMVGYRSSVFKTAQKLLDDYSNLLTKTPEFEIFDAIRVYLKTALYRAQGDVNALSCILPDALDKAERIAAGIVSAAIYLLAATVTSLFESKDDQVSKMKGYSPDVLSIRALEHLKYVLDSPIVRADMEQKSHITLALFYLGCNIFEELTKKKIDSKSLEKAKSNVMAVRKSCKGNAMNYYREIQFNILQSVLSYRYSQIQPERKNSFLQEAFGFSKRAEYLASKYNFVEMLNWARTCMVFCTEE
jgi:hypothetical protein